MLNRLHILVICAGVLAWLALPGHAQKMYRCGNAYQDRPCENTQQSREVRNFGGASHTPADRSNTDVQCVRMGEEAVKIVWARESGATQEQQLASRPQDRWLIETVYMRRGSAPEIRSAVEASCMAERERQAAAMAAAAAARTQGPAMVSPASSQGDSAADFARMQERQAAEVAANREAFKEKRCAELARRADDLRGQERTGGSSATMQRLHELRSGVEETRRREGC